MRYLMRNGKKYPKHWEQTEQKKKTMQLRKGKYWKISKAASKEIAVPLVDGADKTKN